MTKPVFVDSEEQHLEDRRKLITAYQRTFNSPDGKIVLADLQNEGHYNSTLFDSDPMVTSFRLGERNMVIGILEKLDEDPRKEFPEEVTEDG